jgi:hypothetical protein
MKKLTANRGQRREGVGRDVIETLKMFLSIEVGLVRREDGRPIVPALIRI